MKETRQEREAKKVQARKNTTSKFQETVEAIKSEPEWVFI